MAADLSSTLVRFPAAITMDAENLYVDGVAISYALIPQLLYDLVHPSNRKWYRLERIENRIIVHVRISDEPFEVKPIATIGE